MATSPFSDPLTFWSRVLLRLGIVLAVLAVAPAAIDFVVFKGGAIVLATIALYTLAPLAALSLLIGAGLWVWSRFRA